MQICPIAGVPISRFIVMKSRSNDYVYEDTPYWDPIAKQGRHNRRYLGYYDGDVLVYTGTTYVDRNRRRYRIAVR